MEVGTPVWVRDSRGEDAWLPAAVVRRTEAADGGCEVVVRIEGSREERSFRTPAGSGESDDLKFMNDADHAVVEDLISLPHLHEPAILHALQVRFYEGNIYTFTGPILIAVNPFQRVPLYTNKILESYFNRGLMHSQGMEFDKPLAPHVYAIADAAYRDMMIRMYDNSQGGPVSQAILISGESGAGKTESTKVVMKYLTTVGNNTGSTTLPSGSVMDKVLQSNPILEAFGNARTIRNDNSSRFGKFIEMHFNKRGLLVGASIRTYLLEKVRIPNQAENERNFHIFYQLCAGASAEERARWRLGSIQSYHYANQGHCFTLRHVDDRDEWEATRRAMETLNFGEQDINALLSCVAGLLHLGQVNFVTDSDGEGAVVAPNAASQESIVHAAELCGLDPNHFASAMTTRTMETRGELFTIKLKADQAVDARDALAKALYGRLFDWIVTKVNDSIQCDRSEIRADVSVLDIFGFECFKVNSFEQLCINYTNETLQQQFNQFVFKMEQEEYEREQIEWSFIEFPDNQDCLDLIEHRTTGILAALDDECKLPKGSDEKFAARLYKALNHARFSADARQKRDGKFCIRHYAGVVEYTVTTFVEKNKDQLPKETSHLFCSSRLELVNRLFAEDGRAETRSGKQQFKSVGVQFKESLHSLMEKIYSNKPHYIRCIKPNDENVPEKFWRARTAEQLRYGGVLEAVRVSRSGFPIRMKHELFFAQYRLLANPFSPVTRTLPTRLNSTTEAKEMSVRLLEALMDVQSLPEGRRGRVAAAWLTGTLEPGNIQFGLTKVFLRKMAYDVLEGRRSRRLVVATTDIQALIRCFNARRAYLAMKWAARLLQRVVRGMQARSRAREIRFTHAAVVVQRYFRGYQQRTAYQRFRAAIVLLQARHRAAEARVQYQQTVHNLNAIRLQRMLRGLVARKRYRAVRRSVVAVQCLVRARRARAELKRLRMEAKDVGRLQQSNEALKAEIQMLREQAEKAAQLAAERLRAEQMEAAQHEQARLLAEIEQLKAELAAERKLREEAEAKNAELQVMLKEERHRLVHATERLEARVHATATSPTARSNSTEMVGKEHYASLLLELELANSELARERAKNHDQELEIQRLTALSHDIVGKLEAAQLSHLEEIESLGSAPSTPSKHRQQNAASEIKPLREPEPVSSPKQSPKFTPSLSRLFNNGNKQSGDDSKATTPVTTERHGPSIITTPDPGSASQTRKNIAEEVSKLRQLLEAKKKGVQTWEESWDDDDETATNNNSTDEGSQAESDLGGYGAHLLESASPRALEVRQNQANHVSSLLSNAKAKLREGLHVVAWEVDGAAQLDVTMQLKEAQADGEFDEIAFVVHARPRRLSTLLWQFAQRAAATQIAPIMVQELYEVQAGHLDYPAVLSSPDGRDSGVFLTMLTLPDPAGLEGKSRKIIVKLASREDRNMLMGGLNLLMSEHHYSPAPSSTLHVPAPAAMPNAALQELERVSDEGLASTTAPKRSTSLSRAGPNASPNRRASRRLSKPMVNPEDRAVIVELTQQVAAERAVHEKMMSQVMQLTTELTDSADLIVTLKRQLAAANSQLERHARDDEETARANIQISMKLSQLLVDKEEYRAQVDDLKRELLSLRAELEYNRVRSSSSVH